jgi:hypothetical protein
MVNNHLRFEPECSARGVNLFHIIELREFALTTKMCPFYRGFSCALSATGAYNRCHKSRLC